MASILRSIVAGPRARHPEAGLDLCYVTDNIIATSGPSGTYPSRAYRNPLDALVRFLDSKHGEDWAIWEFRAEGTGYPDSEVYNRVWHYPWPDHHPPPFHLIPNIMASMRNWLKGDNMKAESTHDKDSKSNRVVVVHCKAGKGRSGSMAVSYLLSEEGWTIDAALKRFTERRMRPGMGKGVSIPSQLRWIDYVERWAKNGKVYVEQMIQVLEVHVEGLKDGVKIAVEGYVDEGRTIKTFHVFKRDERDDVTTGEVQDEKLGSLANVVLATAKNKWRKNDTDPDASTSPTNLEDSATSTTTSDPAEESSNITSPTTSVEKTTSQATENVIFRPSKDLIIPTNDVNLAVERRSRAGYGLTMVTSVAHVWFNCFFEGNGPENMRQSSGANEQPTDNESNAAGPDDSGVYTITWNAMDGIKGSSKKGISAFEKVSILWRVAREQPRVEITEPPVDAPVQDVPAADWKGTEPIREDETGKAKDESRKNVNSFQSSAIGLRPERPDSADISKASSVKDGEASPVSNDANTTTGQRILNAALKAKSDIRDSSSAPSEEEDSEDGASGIQRGILLPSDSAAGNVQRAQTDLENNATTGNVEGDTLRDRHEHHLGDIKVDKKHDITSS